LQSILPRFLRTLMCDSCSAAYAAGFTKPLAERFDAICNLRVKEAEDGDIVEAGNIYIAPAVTRRSLIKRRTV